MIKYHKTTENTIIAELKDDSYIISHTQDALDLMSQVVTFDCSRIIINEKNLHSDFFKLRTALAGEILQKFSNYDLKLAIVGDFTKYKSRSLQDFIRESNRGNMIFFIDSLDSAIKRLSAP